LPVPQDCLGVGCFQLLAEPALIKFHEGVMHFV
jgi:hypothetical protein